MTTKKMVFGRENEDFVQRIIECKTGYAVNNLNDVIKNHPITDLRVSSENVAYEVSIKAKNSPTWTSVRGVQSTDQYIVFVDVKHDDRVFYILNQRQWKDVLIKILPDRSKKYPGAEIIDGAIEWNWIVDNQPKKRRGSYLKPEEISLYKDNWSVLPGVHK